MNCANRKWELNTVKVCKDSGGR